MLEKVVKYLDAYITTNKEVMEAERYADVIAAKAYVEALMERKVDSIEDKADRLRELLFTVMKERCNNDVRVKRSEFLEIYKEAMDTLGADECELYGNDVTVHWHGIYCNCSDGATAWNHIVSNIESVIDEDGDD